MLIVAICIFIAGAALLVWGIRGRRIDDHPLCRKCGFDLFGRPITSSQCSECGADVTGPKAIRMGHRARRRVPLLLAVPLILLGAAGTGVLIYSRTDEATILRHAPLWWVLYRAETGSWPQQNPASMEILRRTRQHELSPAQVRSLVDRMLQCQTNPKSQLYYLCTVFLHNALDSGEMTDEQAGRYLMREYSGYHDLVVRSRVRAGAVLPFGLLGPGLRESIVANVSVHPCRARLIVDGQHTVLDWTLSGDPVQSCHQLDGTIVVPADTLSSLRLPIGEHTATLQIDVEFLLKGAVVRRCPSTLAFTTKWQLVNEPTVTLAGGFNDRMRMWTALQLIDIDGVEVFALGPSPVERRLNLPMPIAADVLVRGGGHDTPKGPLVLRKDMVRTAEIDAMLSTKKLFAKVILRPNAALAEQTIDLFEIWGEEISPTVSKWNVGP